MFKELTQTEKEEIIFLLVHGKISIVGRTQSQNILLVKPLAGKNKSFKQIECTYKSNRPVEGSLNTTFSFVANTNKFLFSAICHIQSNDRLIFEPSTEIFMLHRRNSERLYLPEEYYALVKISYFNNKLVRLFAKINNISIGGCSLHYRSENPIFAPKDIIKGSLHFSSRPPIDFEGEIRHRKIITDNNIPIQSFGILFLPSDSLAVAKRMRVVLMDIYRDLFSENESK